MKNEVKIGSNELSEGLKHLICEGHLRFLRSVDTSGHGCVSSLPFVPIFIKFSIIVLILLLGCTLRDKSDFPVGGKTPSTLKWIPHIA